ncbi:MAG: hypothetical protein ABTQ29_08155 [Siculibacillus sp.]
MSDACFKGFTAEAAIGAYRIVKFGTADHQVVLATGSSDLAIGVSDLATDAGDVVDVALGEFHEVVLGGTVIRGQPLTSDANAAAVAAAPAAGVNAVTIGFALQSGVAGDIITYFGQRGVIQG